MDRRGELAKAHAPRSGLGEKIGLFEPRGRVIGRLVLEHGEGAGPLARGTARDAALRGLACPIRGASHRRVQSYDRDDALFLGARLELELGHFCDWDFQQTESILPPRNQFYVSPQGHKEE